MTSSMLVLVFCLVSWRLVGGLRTVNIGLLSEMGCCNWMSVYDEGSAINIAFDDLHADGVLSDVNVSIIWRDTKTESQGLGNAVDLVNNEDIDVILGSPSSRINIAVAMLTAFWNLPQISWESRSNELSNKALFPTFARTSTSFGTIGLAFAGLFREMGWTKVGFLYEDFGRCQYALNAIKSTFNDVNITMMQSIAYERVEDPAHVHSIDTYLKLVKQTSRVIILCDYLNIRQIMIRAWELGMCNGDYIFIMPSDTWLVDGEKIWESGDQDDHNAKAAFRYLIDVTFAYWYSVAGKENLIRFGQEVVKRMAEPPWNDPYLLDNNLTASKDAQYLYDATYLYGLWLNYSTTQGLDRRNGSAMLTFVDGLQFEGVSGPCLMNGQGDRVPVYWIWDFTNKDGIPEIAAMAEYRKDSYTVDTEDWRGFTWLTADGQPPLASPICGFFNELCIGDPSDNTSLILTLCVSVLAVLAMAVVVGYVIRKRQLENRMLKMIWKINISDIEMRKSKLGIGSRTKLRSTNQSCSSIASGYSNSGSDYGGNHGPLTSAGMYKGQSVSVRNVVLLRTHFTRQDLIELKEMREMQHDNIDPFIGACVDVATPCVLFLCCPKGSLQDILENDDIQLDSTFKNSLMLDLVQGMRYIHDSKLGFHGRLKSTNCVVDNRWVLRVTDYGLNRFSSWGQDRATEEHQYYKSLLWSAPEILDTASRVLQLKGTKEGDVYSFGIILHELFYRMGTFAGSAHLTFKEITDQVRRRLPVPCRPQILDSFPDVGPEIIKLMMICWQDTEKDRPSFKIIRNYMKKNCHDVNRNIVDVILRRLEKYASNLEELVEQRTHLLMEEKQKTDKLLYRMMPAICADKLKLGETVYPELYDAATVFFSDIVGFTTLAGMSSPMQVVDLLNDLYIQFDEIIAQFDAYKVETIGDAYLVVSGIPKRNGDLHAGVIADMSLQIMSTLMRFRVRHLPHQKIMVRIGMHTGPCCAGVVGLSMPRYCLFGDTVNTASRMESNGKRMYT